MPIIAPAYMTLNPSFTEPELLLPYSQASGAFDLLPGSDVRIRLNEGDQAIFVHRVDVRTKMAAGQSSYNQLPSVDIALSYVSSPTYLMQVRAEYNHHDIAASSRWGVDLVSAQRLGMRQGHFQLMRSALLYGFNPATGEGLLNGQGITTANVPPDSNGNDTANTYDNGQFGSYLQQVIANIKFRTNQLGIGHKFVILGPQRILGQFEYNVVELVQFQRVGAGTTSTAGMVKEVLMQNGDELTWSYDDTLEGKGFGGTDAIIITMPEVYKPEGTPYNTNEFARLAPGLMACNLMYADMAAPMEIPTPIAGGAIDILSEMRISPGWPIRPEATTVLSFAPS